MLHITNENFAIFFHGIQTAVTIGNFDGQHAGHRRLFGEVTACAEKNGLAPVFFSFRPHTAIALGARRDYRLITSYAERLRNIGLFGADYFVEYPFSKEFAEMPPEAFLDMIYGGLNCRYLFLGEGYRFGKNRAGDLTLCRKAAEGRGVGVVSVEHVTDGGVKVSSSEIRRLIAEKKFREAARLLGRPYALYLENGGYSVNAARGLVINAFAPPEKLLPPDGEYSVTVGGYETSIGLCGGNITLPLGEAAYREGMELNIEFI